jgi:hypothetical protein
MNHGNFVRKGAPSWWVKYLFFYSIFFPIKKFQKKFTFFTKYLMSYKGERLMENPLNIKNSEFHIDNMLIKT